MTKSLLTDQQITQWRQQGYVLVQLPPKIWKNAYNLAHKMFPPKRPSDFIDDFGYQPSGKYQGAFPTGNNILDSLPLNEELIKIAQELLQTDLIRLTQSQLWCKYRPINEKDETDNEDCNSDQRIHMDFGNHTFAMPSKWEDPDILSCILYYDDSEICGGGTKVVPRIPNTDDPAYKYPESYLNQIGYGKHAKFINNKTLCEKYFQENDQKIYNFRKNILYPREVQATFKPGTILLYRHDIWHRGAPIKIGQSRRVHNLVYKRADRDHVLQWNKGLGQMNYYGQMEELMVGLTPLQRTLLYFPAVGDEFWKDEGNLWAIEQRYPGIDLSPYRVKRVKK